MNRRQKKKRFKRIHGFNPPKGPDGKFIYNIRIGIDLAEGKDSTEMPTPEQIKEAAENMQKNLENLQVNLKCVADALRNGMSMAADALGKAFMRVAEAMKPVKPEQQQDSCVVVAKALTERRKKKCQRKGWKASKR